MAQQTRKTTQRERLLQGMVDAANRSGYARASVTAVIENAHVSRPTFYEYFADRDDCFRAAIEDVQHHLLQAVEDALSANPAHEALAAAVCAVLDYATEEPGRARFLMGESIAGGEQARDVRDSGVAQIAAAIEQAFRGARAGDRAPDLEPRVVIGSVYRMVAKRLRRGEASISQLADELLAWLAAYERPVGRRPRRMLKPAWEPSRSAYVPDVPIQQMPELFPPGRPRIPEVEIAENHRMRILHAAAQLAFEKGCVATTVSDITRLARVDGSVFYRLFANKQDAFAAVHEFGFLRVIDVASRAFFATEGWPQRSWEAGKAFTQLLQANPLVAHIGFVEAFAIGPAAVQRIEDSHVAFMFFFQEGLLYREEQPPPSRVAMEAIIDAIFEIVYVETRRREESRIAAMLAPIERLWLAPFMGVEDADAFIDSNIKRTRVRG
jgi:AcrR family transcriptional regulator